MTRITEHICTLGWNLLCIFGLTSAHGPDPHLFYKPGGNSETDFNESMDRAGPGGKQQTRRREQSLYVN